MSSQAGTTLRRACSAPSMSAQLTPYSASLRAISSVEMQQPSSPQIALQSGLQPPSEQPPLPLGNTLLPQTSASDNPLAPYLPLAQQLQQMRLQPDPQGKKAGISVSSLFASVSSASELLQIHLYTKLYFLAGTSSPDELGQTVYLCM